MSDATRVLFRLQRTIREDTFVTVHVTGAVMVPDPERSGERRLDVAALAKEAVRLGASSGVEWSVESENIEPHPTQCPLPEGRRAFESHDDEG